MNFNNMREKVATGSGFIAALDQSGGSTPKALRGYGMWAVELKDTGEVIGRVGLHNPEGWPDLELGWMLRPECRHHGYATEAARCVLDYAFAHLDAERAISLIRTENTESERVARRLGGRQSTTIDFLGSATLVYTYHRPDGSN